MLSFFKNMYGIKIIYQADILGFLKKDGTDEKLMFPLPYPVYELV
jgi:hypothetical protein